MSSRADDVMQSSEFLKLEQTRKECIANNNTWREKIIHKNREINTQQASIKNLEQTISKLPGGNNTHLRAPHEQELAKQQKILTALALGLKFFIDQREINYTKHIEVLTLMIAFKKAIHESNNKLLDANAQKCEKLSNEPFSVARDAEIETIARTTYKLFKTIEDNEKEIKEWGQELREKQEGLQYLKDGMNELNKLLPVTASSTSVTTHTVNHSSSSSVSTSSQSSISSQSSAKEADLNALIKKSTELSAKISDIESLRRNQIQSGTDYNQILTNLLIDKIETTTQLKGIFTDMLGKSIQRNEPRNQQSFKDSLAECERSIKGRTEQLEALLLAPSSRPFSAGTLASSMSSALNPSHSSSSSSSSSTVVTTPSPSSFSH